MNLFTYGTLMNQGIMIQVSGGEHAFRNARLFDFVRRTVRGEVYPAIERREGECVDGVVYFDLSPEALDRLDAFEGSLYVRSEVDVICDNKKAIKAYTYVISPAHSDRMSENEWHYDQFIAHYKERFRKNYQGYKDIEFF